MINEIIKKIELQDEIETEVLQMEAKIDYDSLEPYITMLYCRDTWNTGEESLKKALGNDPQGIKMLTVMLHCGVLLHDNYVKAGIDEIIYVDTMKCFTRFLNEHKENYGSYKFDRSFWTTRQISMHLFRIGELEYELDNKDGEKIVSMHIPSDADILLPKLQNSYRKAKEFLRRYYPEYSEVKMMCESWLLSPSLEKLLPKTSKILNFQKSFIITATDWEDKGYLEWVYKVNNSFLENCKLDDLPENTSLQKNMKNYLLNGGKVGMAAGILSGFCG